MIEQKTKMSPQILKPCSIPDPHQCWLGLTRNQLMAGAVLCPAASSRAAEMDSCWHGGPAGALPDRRHSADVIGRNNSYISLTLPFWNCFEVL